MYRSARRRWLAGDDVAGVIAAHHVVIAVGRANAPFIPERSGLDTFKGELMHSPPEGCGSSVTNSGHRCRVSSPSERVHSLAQSPKSLQHSQRREISKKDAKRSTRID